MRKSYFETLLTSCLGRFFLGIAVAFVMFAGMGMIALVGSILPVPEEIRAIFILVLSLFFLFVILAVIIIFVVNLSRRRTAVLDDAFRGFGLVGARYMLMGRQYSGSYLGRQINVYSYTSGGRYNRVPVLQFYVAGDIPTRVGVGTRNILSTMASGLLNRTALPIDDPSYAEIEVYPEDENWARGLFTNEIARREVAELLGDNIPGSLRALMIGPGSVNLTLRYFNPAGIDPEILRMIMNRLIRIADAAEDQPRPATIIQESDLSRRSRSDRGSLRWIVWVIIGLILLCPLAVGGIAFLWAMLAGS